jgi:hypothetical protein
MMKTDLQNAALSDEALDEVSGGILPLLAIAAGAAVAAYVAPIVVGAAIVAVAEAPSFISHLFNSGAHYQN